MSRPTLPRVFTVFKPALAHPDAAASDTCKQHLGSHGRTYNRMADDTRRPSAQSARAEPTAGWGEPSLGGGDQRESVGERLKRERETYGLHLREVSESLRIRYAYLDAIERSAFDELPGPTYAVGFVRGYAQFLGLDDDRIVQRFKDESQGLKRDQELHFPEPVNEGKIPGGAILVLSIALIAAAYGAWAYLSDGERSVADLVPEVPESLQRMVGATEAPPVPEATDLTGTRTGDPATGDPATGDPATGDPAGGNGGGDLDGEQISELPETAPDPDLSGEASPDAPAASQTQTQTQTQAQTQTQSQTGTAADGPGSETPGSDTLDSNTPDSDIPEARASGTTSDTPRDTTRPAAARPAAAPGPRRRRLQAARTTIPRRRPCRKCSRTTAASRPRPTRRRPPAPRPVAAAAPTAVPLAPARTTPGSRWSPPRAPGCRCAGPTTAWC